MNRQDHLLAALPTWLGKGFAEIVILDWSSDAPLINTIGKFQDGTITLVELVEKRETFSHAKSKNLKVRLARHSVVCSLDCDIQIVDADFLSNHILNREQFFYRGVSRSLTGSALFRREDWRRFKGCNEAMVGWGTRNRISTGE